MQGLRCVLSLIIRDVRDERGTEEDTVPVFALFAAGCASAIVVEARLGRVEAAVVSAAAFAFRVLTGVSEFAEATAPAAFAAFLGGIVGNRM